MWVELPNEETVKETIEALKGRGVNAEFLQNKADALKRITQLIPSGAELSTGASLTLEEIGFTDLLKSGNHPWNNLKAKIVAEKDPVKQTELRIRSVTVEYFLGSVHAVTQSGEIIVASKTGSQLGPYAYSSKNVIWVVGAQKKVANLALGMKRVREYCLPLEDKRMKAAGSEGSSIGKLLTIERENLPFRKLVLIFVNEKLGF